MLGPIVPPTPCEVLLATIRACTVRAICSALKRAEPDSRGGEEEGRGWRKEGGGRKEGRGWREKEGGRKKDGGGRREEGSRYAMAEDERGKKEEEMRKEEEECKEAEGEEKGTTSRHKSWYK